ncbi:sensor histidine kinase [Desertibacillus haloalkaliphilus]|uniref:sensor histidine kinase n=1 Tax=Desertibacillus haloalkaliphilus TaxID=1328930 RepID=UPI0028ABDA29|nr:ATP-binding protein [Desertibacillus haloalkaliphilus]
MGLLLSYFVKGYIFDTKQEELLRQAKKINVAIHDQSIDQNLQEKLAFYDESFDVEIWIFNSEGEITATSTEDEVYIGKSVSSTVLKNVISGREVVNELDFEGLKEPMLSVVVPLGKDSTVYGGVVLHSPVKGMNEVIGNIRESILWLILVGVLISTIFVSYLSWTISRPLQKINRAVSEIGMGNFNQRITIDSADELGELAATINHMSEKLDKVEGERQRIENIRTDFLANFSHEFRTPLTAMQGFIEALQDDLIAEKGRKKYYNVMYEETMNLNCLVDDLMDLIKLRSQETKLLKETVHVNHALEKVLLKFQTAVEEKGLSFKVRSEEESLFIYADPSRLNQVIDNLLANALKFTNEGSISITAKRNGENIELIISDTGIGISEADLPYIWERFFKVDRGRAKENKGTGLGLAIVKELIELHDGNVSVHSQIGVGTTFSITLPSVTE